MCNADAFFKENEGRVDNKTQTGFNKFLGCLDLYLDVFDDFTLSGETQINIYGSVTLENGGIMRATNNFHNKAWFSDIAIVMDSDESSDYISDQGLCYEQVIYQLYITNIFIYKIFIFFIKTWYYMHNTFYRLYRYKVVQFYQL